MTETASAPDTETKQYLPSPLFVDQYGFGPTSTIW